MKIKSIFMSEKKIKFFFQNITFNKQKKKKNKKIINFYFFIY